MTSVRHWFRSLAARYGRRTLIALACIAALGLVFRAVVVVHPVADPADDSHAYYALAKSLYEEGSYGGKDFKSEATSDWSPGAPWLYAGLFVVTGGPREGTIRILEALMGVGTILLVFLLGWRLGGRWPALLAALGVAIYPPFIHSVGEIMSEPPAMLSLPAAILAFFWAWDRPPRGRSGPWIWLVPGFLFGVTAMFRPEYTVVAAAFVVFAAARYAWGRQWRLGTGLRGRPDGGRAAPADRPLDGPQHRRPAQAGADLDRRRQGPLRRHFLPRRRRIRPGQGDPAEGTDGRRTARPHSQALNEVNPTELFTHVWESTYPELERDTALGKIGKENFSKYFGEHPVGYAEMTVRKVGRMWSSGTGAAMQSGLGKVIQVIVVLLGIAGLVLLGFRRRWWETLCLATPIVLVTIVGAATLAAPRRNEILMTLIIPLAALALAEAASALSSGRKWSH